MDLIQLKLLIENRLGKLNHIYETINFSEFSFLNNIFEFSCKFFIIPKNIFQNTFSISDLNDFMTGSDKKKTKGINLCNKKLSPNVLTNSKLKEIICENLDFIK